MDTHILLTRSELRIVLAFLCTVLLAGPLPAQTNCVFDATSGNAVVPHAPSLNLAPRLTFEAWLKAAPPKPSDYGPVADKDYVTGPGFGVVSIAQRRDSVEASFVYANNFVIGPRIASDSLTWTHVAVTVDTTIHTAVFYVNGVQTTTVTGSTVTFANNSSDLSLGSAKYGDRFSGCIDEVRIWNVIRTPSEISALWNHEARGNEPGLVALYHFEDQRDTIAWNRAAGGGLNGPLTPGARIISVPWTIAFTDEHENNGSFANATPVNYGSSILSAAVAPGDTDIYKIYTRPGDIYQVRTTAKNAGDQVNLRVSVYGPDTLTHITSYIGVFPSLYTAASVAGYHYVRVTVGSSGSGGPYLLATTLSGALSPDQFEPNNTTALATPCPWGSLALATIFPGFDGGTVPPDTDYYSVTAQAGEIGLFPYAYQNFPCGSGWLTMSGPSGGIANTYPNYLANMLFPSSGTYYVRIIPNEAAHQYLIGMFKGLADVNNMLYDPVTYGSSLFLADGMNNAYDLAYILKINGAAFDGLPDYTHAEAGGRQFVFGPTTMSGLTVKRKFFVPTAAQGDTLGFMRIQEVLTNPTGAPITVTVGVSSNLGSDAGTRILATSSGDTLLTVADTWLQTDDNVVSGGTPVLTHIFDGQGGADRVDSVKLTHDVLYWEWRNVAVPAGETKIYMYYVAQDSLPAKAAKKGPAFSGAALPAGAKLGLDADAIRVMNWPTATLVSVKTEETTPLTFSLSQNYPNPFNPSTTIKFELPASSMAKLSVYDILGRLVTVLVNERKTAGSYEVKFDAAGLSSGVYFYRLQAGDFTQTKRLLLLK